MIGSVVTTGFILITATLVAAAEVQNEQIDASVVTV